MYKEIKDKIAYVKRISDRFTAINLVLNEKIINIVSANTLKVGLEGIKKQWEKMDGFGVPRGERILSDLNGHVGKNNMEYKWVYGGFGFRNRNVIRDLILEFVVAYHLAIANTFKEERWSFRNL